MNTTYRALVAGAGLAGVAAATALHQLGWQVDLAERRQVPAGGPFRQHDGAMSRSGGLAGRAEHRQFLAAVEDSRVSARHRKAL